MTSSERLTSSYPVNLHRSGGGGARSISLNGLLLCTLLHMQHTHTNRRGATYTDNFVRNPKSPVAPRCTLLSIFLDNLTYCTVDTLNRKIDTLLTFKADEDEVLRELDALIGEGSAAAAGDDNLKLPAAPDDEPEQLDEQLPDVPAHEPAKVSLFVVTLSSTGLNMQRNTKQ